MSIDHCYSYSPLEGKFLPIFGGKAFSDFWVDICHGANFAIDERYYFPDLASALDFYLEGWKGRQFVDADGKGVGLDHSGLYSRGRLIHGLSIHGDAPGHEGEKLRQICKRIARTFDAGGMP